MLRYGRITEMDAAKGRARVKFEEDDIVSDWLAVSVGNSKDNRDEDWYDVDTYVWCMMDANAENGVIGGTLYDKNNPPQVGNADKWVKIFKDGTKIEYDRAAKVLTINTPGDVKVECVNAEVKASTSAKIDTPSAQFTGNVSVDGSLSANGISSSGGIDATGDITTNANVKADANVEAGAVSPLTSVKLLTHMHPTAAPGPPSPPTPGT